MAGWALLGGDMAPTALDWHEAGRWRFAWADLSLRYLSADGVEVLRGIEFLARDADWGTLPARLVSCDSVQDGEALRLRFDATLGEGALDCAGTVTVRGDAVAFTVEARVARDLDTNRTGFVVLHPLAGFSGATVTAEGPGIGSVETRIPERISPGQPLRGFDRLRIALPGGAEASLAFEADLPFEMEDQRNWTDASFKTYYRPLALPFPYRLPGGSLVRQRVSVALRGSAEAPPTAAAPGPCATPARGLVWLPGTALPGDVAALAALKPDRLDAWIDLRDPAQARARAAQAQALAARLAAPLHLRLIAADDADPAQVLRAVAAAAGPVRSAMALPAAFLRSHQPEGPWPDGLPCAQALAAVRAAFPGAEAVEGMLTFFPELNRHPPRAGGDAVTVSTAAIVHAADDLSVMETLEALPAVFATLLAHADGRPADIGLAAIGLWTNPYGAALADNPAWQRRAMTDRDPRSRGLFGAAWLAGYLAHAAQGGIRSVGVGAISGPLSLLAADAGADWQAHFPGAVVRPAFHVAAAVPLLGALHRVTAPGRPGDVAVLWGAALALAANTGPKPAPLPLSARAIRCLDAARLADALADPAWMAGPRAPCSSPVILPPFAIALVET
ncbi:MAG: hypothetical protein ACK4TB_02360 [Gemmobacter sp.]